MTPDSASAPAEVAALPSPAEAYAYRLTIPYTNWRGEFAMREIAPIRMFLSSNEWHPEKQWLIEAWDIAKNEIRTFALKGIGPATTAEADLAAMRSEVERLREALKPFAEAAKKFYPDDADTMRPATVQAIHFRHALAILNASARNEGARQEGET